MNKFIDLFKITVTNDNEFVYIILENTNAFFDDLSTTLNEFIQALSHNSLILLKMKISSNYLSSLVKDKKAHVKNEDVEV